MFIWLFDILITYIVFTLSLGATLHLPSNSFVTLVVLFFLCGSSTTLFFLSANSIRKIIVATLLPLALITALFLAIIYGFERHRLNLFYCPENIELRDRLVTSDSNEQTIWDYGIVPRALLALRCVSYLPLLPLHTVITQIERDKLIRPLSQFFLEVDIPGETPSYGLYSAYTEPQAVRLLRYGNPFCNPDANYSDKTVCIGPRMTNEEALVLLKQLTSNGYIETFSNGTLAIGDAGIELYSRFCNGSFNYSLGNVADVSVNPCALVKSIINGETKRELVQTYEFLPDYRKSGRIRNIMP